MTFSILKNCRTNEIEIVPRLVGKIRDELFSRKFIRDVERIGPDDVRCTYTLSDRDYNDLVSLIRESFPAKRKILTAQEKKVFWCKRLSRLGGVDYNTAFIIAGKRLEYKWRQIDMLLKKQDEHYSMRREKLIELLSRQDPLRYIKDESHASNILKAYRRHCFTDYEDLLKEGHLLAEEGEIDRGEVRSFARRNYNSDAKSREEIRDEISAILEKMDKETSVQKKKNFQGFEM